MKKQNQKEEDIDIKHYSIPGDILYFFKFLKKYEPTVLVCCFIEIVLGAVIPFIGIYLPKLAIDLAVEGVTLYKAVLVLGLFTLMMMLVYGVNNGVSWGKYHLYNTQRTNMLGLIFLKSLRIKYEYTESGRIKKMYWKAINGNNNGDWSALSRMVTETTGLITTVLCFLIYSTVLGLLNIWMVVALIMLSLVNYFISIHEIRYVESLRDEEAVCYKRYNAVRNSLGNVEAAKDIRIFGMNNWLTELMNVSIKDLKVLGRKISRKREWREKLCFLIAMLRDLAAYGYLLYSATKGELDAGEFVLYFGAITGFSGFVSGIMGNIADLRSAANSTDYIRAYLEMPEEDMESGDKHIDDLLVPVKIEFKDISFTYKESEEDDKEGVIGKNNDIDKTGKKIFEHFNLTINAGEKIALVGVNGAGKTTLVKLLTGMYEPDSGKILINGIDRNEFPRKDFYKLFSIVFQEQFILPFTVGENLALDRADRVDEEKAWEALEKAGLKKKFEEKNITLDTFMTKVIMKAGIELSGGEQQRFLLARALYKDGPVLVLDEPTAALDPIAESEVYDNYNKYSGGKTAVFISHRLASTRFSDRIVMLEDGKILEMGTHEELMNKNGAYAEMFRVQSSYYDDGIAEGERGEIYGN